VDSVPVRTLSFFSRTWQRKSLEAELCEKLISARYEPCLNLSISAIRYSASWG